MLIGNLDEVLDPKLTLSDYQITEIFVVAKGTENLTQAFSSNDIMALRKEEERKQMHNKTGGGVFNLIFRKGKSVSQKNRSLALYKSPLLKIYNLRLSLFQPLVLLTLF